MLKGRLSKVELAEWKGEMHRRGQWPEWCKRLRSAVGGRKWSGDGAERLAKRSQSATAPPTADGSEHVCSEPREFRS